MHRSANDSTDIPYRIYRIREAAGFLQMGDRTLRQRMEALGALQPDGTTGRKRANPEWVRQGLLIERHEQFRHPHCGPQWYVRVEVTPAGLDHLRQQLKHNAA